MFSKHLKILTKKWIEEKVGRWSVSLSVVYCRCHQIIFLGLSFALRAHDQYPGLSSVHPLEKKNGGPQPAPPPKSKVFFWGPPSPNKKFFKERPSYKKIVFFTPHTEFFLFVFVHFYLFWYGCYYLHRSRDYISSVYKILKKHF